MIRDDYERGMEMEKKVIKILKKHGIHAEKNCDPYDIDLIVNLCGKSILIEVEETKEKYWPCCFKKPCYPSKLFTMPIRKIKYFIENKTKQDLTLNEYLREKFTIGSIKEFYEEVFEINTRFEGKRDEKIRIYVKGSYNLENLCIVKSNTVIKSLNKELVDQDKVNEQIKEMEQKQQKKWSFWGNLWENREVTNFEGQLRDDPVTLILGHIEAENELIWISIDELPVELYKIACSKS
ncbi:hypothetical protein [Caldicellulosiruptor acetigenus]|uniref:hypothetical protein n=1 Tax=Caldicellulosiruptor acetigenus TaxID=301953 RepID=UPI0004176A1A|nr:hypothetical protein [Caldicellulosiruptor acetigenus]WAM36915.1 hypothetical protein OTK01_000718 [Caldicellulosiruptor acetigenus]